MEKHVQPVPLKLKEDNIKTDELCGCDVGKTSSRPCVMDLGQIREIWTQDLPNALWKAAYPAGTLGLVLWTPLSAGQ